MIFMQIYEKKSAENEDLTNNQHFTNELLTGCCQIVNNSNLLQNSFDQIEFLIYNFNIFIR